MHLAVLLRLPLLCALQVHAASIWQEGEKPAKSTMHRHPWWFDQVKKDLLSEGDWISNFAKEPGTAEYAIDVPQTGEYTLWVRACPTNARLAYALAGGDWTEIDLQKEPRGTQNIAADGKPDLRFIAWVKADSISLTKGSAVLSFRMHGTKDNHGGIDCFCLTNDGFIPQGMMKPGAALPGGPSDWFPLLAAEDTFSPESVIDMSALIESPAGKHGRLVAAGDKLVFEKQRKPVKIWGCGANLEQGSHSREESLRRIRYLKKFGINAVRQHPLFDEISTAGRVDAKKLDSYDWWFAELKKAGIYTNWSVFYHFPISPADGYEADLFAELEPMGSGNLRDTYGLITISPQLWEIRTKVVSALLNHKNPYTGLRYADDPALIAVEFQNEDSVFFWNPLGELANPTPKKWKRHAQMLRRQFAAWVKAKYRSDDALRKAWGKLDGESLSAGELGLMGPWEIDSGGIRGRYAGQTQRAGDQIQFLTGMQMDFYRKAEAAHRATGYKGLTITTNWLGGSGLLDQANIFTDTAASLIDRHNYAGGGAGGHGIAEGQVYAGSHLSRPGSHLFSIALKQVEDRPFSMTEWTMCPPTQWKVEAAPIFAFYGMGLQGWDSSYHFAQSGTRLGEGWPRMSSYVTDTPHYIGQFPALAFALHKSHVTEAPVVAARRTVPAQLFSGKPAWLQDYYNGNDLIPAPGGTPLEVFAIGRATVGFQGGASDINALESFWDRKSKIITSATGELRWDYGREVILVTTPKTQAIIGRASGRAIQLPAVTANIQTPFVSLIFTPLDDQPLIQSSHILITALARDKQTGAQYSEDGTRLLSVGTPPLLLEPVQATIKFSGKPPSLARPLDPCGVAKKSPLKLLADGTFAIDGTSQAYYYEVRR